MPLNLFGNELWLLFFLRLLWRYCILSEYNQIQNILIFLPIYVTTCLSACDAIPPSPLLLHGQTVFFFQVQRSKPPQLIGSLLWQHEFLLRTDFTFHVLWQCVPYSPLLTTSSDPVLFSVYFWDQTVVWSGGLPLFLLSRLEMKEEHRVTLGGPCRRREPQGLLLLVSQLAKFPQRWCKPEEVKRQRSAVDWPL